MLDSILSLSTAGLTVPEFVFCTVFSIIFGVIIAVVHMYKNNYSRNFILTLILLPIIVQTVIMLVNGNLGTGVAVAGAFSLVRFRSVPGNSREIASIFLAMAVGLATGMGYVAIGGMLVVVISIVMLIVANLPVDKKSQCIRDLKITIPENLDYEGIFDDLFSEYTARNELLRVKTVNMGSLYELHYHVMMRGDKSEKKFLDELRCRNGNLTIVCGRVPEERESL
ncbi:MAG: DUF4956 domain-containing protein [Clostridia bacterium]|nr:DUF4956 domain-containing protein [Lachnospiraceae bacterium]NCC00480.1 DUF4956 domain-containing protein [Clostridia bacterium]NCD02491.1 DUF4956 domain-containing protein [Clostridia bacterium]